MTSRIYADNAATSFPKPPEVLRAMNDYAQRLGASAGRGAYREAVEAGQVVAACRERLATLFHAADPLHIVFTLNCSEALNLALRGWLRAGDHVVTTRFEHNSILRPLTDLARRIGVRTDYVPVDPATGMADPADLARAVRSDTRLIALHHGSNVSGALQPIAEVGAIAARRGAAFLVDAAQTAGETPLDVQAMNIDFLAFPGHKGLLGPLGTGGLYIRPGREGELLPLMTGGTGSASDQPVQPEAMPDKFESGSHNAIGLAGLSAGVQWILQRTVASLERHGRSLSARFLERTQAIDGLVVYGPRDPTRRVPVFSVRLEGLDPAELAGVLEAEFGILARSGIQCAPWAHETLGTNVGGGTTRLSFGPFNTLDDVDACVDALAAVGSTAGQP